MENESLNFPMVLAYAAPLFAAAVALEWLFIKRNALNGRYEAKDALASMTMGLGNFISDILMGFMSLGVLMWLWQYRFIDLGHNLAIIALALVCQDFIYYWKHRAAHVIRWFWSAHVVHHSSEHYNLSTALRQPWNNHFTGHVILSAPLILFGFHPLVIGFVSSLNLIYQFWIHTEAIKHCPRWFEAVFNTPSHHRVHHGTNPRYLDCNFAGILIIWDKIFGTFCPEQDSEEITYGIIKPVGSYNPVTIAFAEMFAVLRDAAQSQITLKQRLKYIFAAPGYSHNNTRKSSKVLKEEYVRENPEQNGTAGLPRLKL